MSETVLSAVRLVLPDSILDNAWIHFDKTEILAFGAGAPVNASNVVDGQGMYLAPGLVDTHVHGAVGSDFLEGTPEAFEKIATHHLSRGTTTLSPTLATTTYENIARAVATWEQMKSRLRARLLPLHLEGPHLTPSKAGAQDPKLLTPPSEDNIDWLVEHAAALSQMTVAPELPNALKLIERCSQAGIVTSAGHSEAREPGVSAAMERGLSKVTHLFNAMTYAGKNGLFREPGLAEYALVEDRLGCELIADGFHAAPTFLKLAVRNKGAKRIALVSDALAGAGLPVGSLFKLGNLSCRVAEGVCTLADGSALSGSSTTLIDQVSILHQRIGVPLVEAIRMASLTPASLVRVADKLGSIEHGKAPDFVLFDDTFQVRSVWVAGERAV